jgi:peroxiredoxin/tetratricopeptide (TPR) repeat protein
MNRFTPTARHPLIALVLVSMIGFVADTEAWAQSRVEMVAERYQRPPQFDPSSIGRVDFPITCQVTQVQELFNQGVVWLHVQEFEAAERCFRQASRLDINSAMTWWGLAAANAENTKLANYYIDKAAGLRDRVTPRECHWIEAWMDFLDTDRDEKLRRSKLLSDLDRIAIESPSETEPRAFLVRQIIENRIAGLPILQKSLVDALIDTLERNHPLHPVSCYRVLLWETDHPEHAVASARRIAKTLSGSSTAMTIAGRLFSRIEQVQEALACFEGSYEAACHRSRVEKVCLHEITGIQDNAARWISELRRTTRYRDAIELARNLIELPSLKDQRSEDLALLQSVGSEHGESARPASSSSTVIGQRLLLETLLESKRWQDLNVLLASSYLQSDVPEIVSLREKAVGILKEEFECEHGRDPQVLNPREVTRSEPLVFETPLAPSFSLLDRHEQPISLESFRGNLTLLVFYLGAGCPHCIEQLQMLVPLRAEFNAAGLNVLAISTDSVAGLQETFKVTGAEDAVPFLLVSDASLETFKAYGAFDQLGKLPLHGVFLIDEFGKILWQRIGTKPFMETRDLLQEAKRIGSLRPRYTSAEASVGRD